MDLSANFVVSKPVTLITESEITALYSEPAFTLESSVHAVLSKLYSSLRVVPSISWLSVALALREIVLFTSPAGEDMKTAGALLSKRKLNIPSVVAFPALSFTVTFADPLASSFAGIVIE